MLEFKTIETLKPNAELLEVIKDFTYKIKKGKIKHLLPYVFGLWEIPYP